MYGVINLRLMIIQLLFQMPAHVSSLQDEFEKQTVFIHLLEIYRIQR